MQVISHRGYWRDPAEKNSVAAFRRSFELGYGTETDIRDMDGRLVVSHDPARQGAMTMETLLKAAGVAHPMLALNIKADGLASLVRDAMRNYPSERWFVFDMSVPDTLQQLQCGNPVYIRMSEYERDEGLIDRAAGIWLDAFDTDEWRLYVIDGLAERGLNVCIISPELHGRAPLAFWHALRAGGFGRHPRLILCTDEPERAALFFGEQHD